MQTSSKGAALTRELLLSKCKTDKLAAIKNVNLWGNEIEDLSMLATELPNVEIVSLSLNKISSLRDFQYCSKLQELYLRKNNICDLRDVGYLQKLPSLKVLWLSNNPCAEHDLYRLYVIKMLPGLIKLDNAEVTQEERAQARNFNVDQMMFGGPPSIQVLQKKPSQVSVLQPIQNNQFQSQQQVQVTSVQSVTSANSQQQAKSPFKNEQQIKKLIADQQLKQNNNGSSSSNTNYYSHQSQSHSPMMQQQPQPTASQQSTPGQQQQPHIIKKVRPGSALNNNVSQTSSTANSNQNSIHKNQQQSVIMQQQPGGNEQRSENILCAVLALLKELGESELELVRRDIEKKLQNIKAQPNNQMMMMQPR